MCPVKQTTPQPPPPLILASPQSCQNVEWSSISPAWSEGHSCWVSVLCWNSPKLIGSITQIQNPGEKKVKKFLVYLISKQAGTGIAAEGTKVCPCGILALHSLLWGLTPMPGGPVSTAVTQGCSRNRRRKGPWAAGAGKVCFLHLFCIERAVTVSKVSWDIPSHCSLNI